MALKTKVYHRICRSVWDFKNDHRNVTVVDDDVGIDDSPSKQDRRRMLTAQE